MDQAGFIRGL